MRKTRLMTATALALTLSGLPALALADTTISTATTTPVKTDTAGKLTVTTTGGIKLNSGTAITVNSNHGVSMNGALNMTESASGSTAILIDGGRETDLVVTGTIFVTDSYTPTDKGDKNGTTADGIIEPPYAEGTGRYVIRSTGATPLVGNIDVRSIAEFNIEGNESYGIRVENRLDGRLSFDGTLNSSGNNNVGIAIEDGAANRVYLSGKAVVRGENSSAARLTGDFDSLLIDGEYIASGYWTPTPTQAQITNARPDNLLQSGVAVDVAGNVTNGVWLGNTLTGTNPTVADEDGNGIDDAQQSRAQITSFGSAPALRIASDTQNITIGAINPSVNALVKPLRNYGLYIQGYLKGDGVFQGIDANGIQIGGRGFNVEIVNGIGVTGRVYSVSNNGNSTAFALMSGATTPVMDISGIVSSETNTNAEHGARAIFIDTGANLATINVKQGGSVTATTTGSKGSASAITDLSGTLTTIINNDKISAFIKLTDITGDNISDPSVNRPVAIDVRANTSGFTLTQIDPAPEDTAEGNAIPAPAITGDVLFGSGNDVMTVNGGTVNGNISFGMGNDTLVVNNSALVSNIDFGAGTNTLTIDKKGGIAGRLTGNGTVNLNVAEGSLALSAGSSLNANYLTVGEKGSLSIFLSEDNAASAVIRSTGPVTFAEGANLSLILNDVLQETTRFTVLTGSSIDLGSINSESLETKTPWLYKADLVKNSENTALYADFRFKSQSELGMSNNEFGALDPILGVINQDSSASYELLTRMTREEFNNFYNQYLPDHSGENLITLSRGSQALNRTLSDLTVIPSNTGGQYWLHEETFNTEREYGEVNGFEAGGFVLSGGRERAFGSHNMGGVYISFVTSTPYDSFSIAGEKLVNSDMTIGAYWRYNKDNLRMWAHGGAGYVSVESNRELLTESFSSRTTAKWNGRSFTAGAGAAYEYKSGSFLFGPKVMVGYYGLKEDAYKEAGGGQYFDLSVEDRDSHLLSGTALVNVTFDRWLIKPEAWVGWKQNISADVSPTVAAFQNGNSFTLNAGDIEGGGAIAGFRVRADNAWSYFAIEAEYEDVGPYKGYSLSLKTRFQF